MKRIQSFLSGLIACGVVFSIVSSVSAQTTTKRVATVVGMKGDSRYMTTGSAWKPLKSGTVLQPGTVVQTSMDPGSYVELVLTDENSPSPRPAAYSSANASAMPVSFGSGFRQPKVDQNTIRISENSALGIDKLTSTQTGADVVTDTQLDLKAGRIFGTVRKMSPASTYEIKLPNGVAGIRGTVYDLTAEGVLRVLLGSVGFAYVGPDGNVITQMVGANSQFDARTGQMAPLSAAAVDELSRLAMGMRFTSQPLPVMFTADKTIYFVSPHGKGPPFTPPGPPPWVPVN